jgi:3-deoxy-D-manno-octulosonate 8-phosphate phosphatase (KDO 8-P phosphatase)
MIPQARQVRIAIFDVDGVLSDGGLHYAETGDAMKTFDVRDGMGMKLLQDSGVELAIITSRKAGSVRERAADLGIRHIKQGVGDKYSAFDALLADLGFTQEQSAFLGDDLVDLPVLKRCGFAVTVSDAPAVLKRHADYVTRATGGHGAAREFCEVILHNQGALAAQTARFLGTD